MLAVAAGLLAPATAGAGHRVAAATVPAADSVVVTPGTPPAGPVSRGRPARVRRVAPRPGAVERRPIRRVEILTRDVFDSETPSRLATLRRVANRLHVRTRASTVRSHLLFAAGDPWSERIGRETARNLRALDFLVPRRIEAQAENDSVAVTVETRDLWTTAPEINLETSAGTRTGSVGFTERNLLGLGKSVSVAYREDAAGVSRHLGYDDLNVAGSRRRFHFDAGKGSEGASARLEVGLPFYAEAAPRAYGVTWSRATSVAHLYEDAREVARLDERAEEFSLSYGVRLTADGTIARLTGSFELADRRFGPTRMGPDAAPEFAGSEQNDRRRLLAAELRLWRPRYLELVDINRMDRVEDFDLGPSLRLKAGFAPRLLGSTSDEGYARVRFDGGAEHPLGFGSLRSSVSTRLRPAWLDLLATADTRAYFLTGGHTVVLAAYGIAGAHTSRDFQAVVGGLNGLRAYPVQAVAGRRLWRLNAEDRWIVSPAHWQVVKVGTAAFYDAARAWGPGAAGTGWFQDAGVGLRIGLPQFGLTQVMRFDVAWPVRPTRDGVRMPVFSFGSSQAF